MDGVDAAIWLVWVGLALLLGVMEVLTLHLVFVMLAGGALVGAAGAAFGWSITGQVVAAVAAAVLLLLLVRPMALRRLRRGPTPLTGTASLVGREAVVLEPVHERGGRVKLAGETWSARTPTPDAELPEGSRVRVLAIDGATAVVEALGSDRPGAPGDLGTHPSEPPA